MGLVLSPKASSYGEIRRKTGDTQKPHPWSRHPLIHSDSHPTPQSELRTWALSIHGHRKTVDSYSPKPSPRHDAHLYNYS